MSLDSFVQLKLNIVQPEACLPFVCFNCYMCFYACTRPADEAGGIMFSTCLPLVRAWCTDVRGCPGGGIIQWLPVCVSSVCLYHILVSNKQQSRYHRNVTSMPVDVCFCPKKVNSSSFESVQSLAVVIPDASAMSVFLTIFNVYLHKEIWVPFPPKNESSQTMEIEKFSMTRSNLAVCCQVCSP